MAICILLMVVGFIVIFLSYKISESTVEKQEENTAESTVLKEDTLDQLLKESEEKIRKNAETVLNEKAEEEIGRVDDQLSHLSNEKIMAVSDFSDQILDKIEQNHKEVVFLYDMLNEKENEMKEFVQEIDKSKVVLEELAAKELEKQKIIQHKKIQKELEKERKKLERLEREKEDLRKTGVVQEERETIQSAGANDYKDNKEESLKEPATAKKVSALERMGSTVETVPVEKTEEEKVEIQEPEPQQKNSDEVAGNQNQVILNLYNEGKTIMDIAKLLGKGQGEVKLVIDLFQGVKK